MASPAAAQPPAGTEIRVVEPRAFGHAVGDVVERQVVVVTPQPLSLDEGSLPKAGRINAGLELREVVVERHTQPGATRHELRLRYQIFAAPQQIKAIRLPAISVKLDGSTAPETLRINEWPVFVAPLVAEPFTATAGLPALRPDTTPRLIDTAWSRRRLGLFGLATLILGATLAYRRFAHLLPGHRQAPFADAYRDLRRLGGDSSATAFRRGLQRLHRAFDETAGFAVFADNCERFLAAQPRYRKAQEPILAFFARSRREFFATGTPSEAADVSWLLALCRECRRLERGDA